MRFTSVTQEHTVCSFVEAGRAHTGPVHCFIALPCRRYLERIREVSSAPSAARVALLPAGLHRGASAEVSDETILVLSLVEILAVCRT